MPSSSSALSASTVYSRLCWDCIVKQRRAHAPVRGLSSQASRTHLSGGKTERRRHFHNGRSVHQEATTATTPQVDHLPPPEVARLPIRKRLAQWQEEHGNPLSDLIGLDTAFGIRNVVADSYGEQRTKGQNEGEEANKRPDDEDDLPAADFDQEISQFGGEHLHMGDLVELKSTRTHVAPTLAIFVRTLSSRQIQLITMRGKWVVMTESDINFSVPAFVDKRLVKPIVPYLPEAEVLDEILGQTHLLDPSVSRDITAPVISALTKFHQASESVYRKHASVLDNAHDVLAHATDLRFGTLDRITDRLIGRDPGVPRMAAMYAVRKALLGAGMGFGVDRRSHRKTGVFQIRSKEQLKYVTYAVNWLREYQEHEIATRLASDGGHHMRPLKESGGVRKVKSFIEKARTAVLDSRQYRSAAYVANGAVGPSTKRFTLKSNFGLVQRTAGVEFNDDDRVLIRVLEYAGIQNIVDTEESLMSLLPMILRGTGLYEVPDDASAAMNLGKRVIYAFLLELGVFAPFEDITHYDVNLLLPHSQHSKPLEQLATSLSKLDMSQVNFKDHYADIRKDLKGATAYAIDDATALEIDDAISVTKIAGTDTKAWVHIHIANPTAFIDRDGVFARMAAHLTETYYAPDKNVPLLPSWLSQELFSLASGRPCLTISALLDDSGEMLDVKLEHGKLGKVVKLPYSQLPDVLGIKSKKQSLEPMVVGGNLPQRPPSRPVELTPEQRKDLIFMNKFSMARQAYRIRNRGFPYQFGQPDVTVIATKDGRGLDHMFPRRQRSNRVDGDPIIRIMPQPYENPFKIKQEGHIALVQEMMLVAGEAFSKWCYQRDIPLAYRSMTDIPGLPSYEEAFESQVRGAIAKYGEIPEGIGFNFLKSAGRGSMLIQPKPHPSLGLPMYSKCTSPLRRYGDMISHWQAEAALREEARSGHNSLLSRMALDPKNHTFLPFSYSQMESIISRLHPRESLISSSKQRSIRHWITQFMFRAHHFDEYPLPATYKVIVLRHARQDLAQKDTLLLVTWMDTGLVFKMRPPASTSIEFGDIWEAEIDTIAPFYADTILSPVRLVQREADVLARR